MSLEIQAIDKSFDDLPVLRRISFRANAGEVAVLLGPSGCGKTTLLRIIAGLEEADAGTIFWMGQDMTGVPVHQRKFGMVFQDFALFPHKSVGSNIAFGLRMQSWPDKRRDKRVNDMLELVGLEGFRNRRVFELSGGEKQRVALARSLAPSPSLLLLDEPLSSLDRALRERLMIDLRSILKQAGAATGHPEGITSLYVTHDQEEAFSLADRVIVMGKGSVEQIGTPEQLYNQPKNSHVARFLGMRNLLPSRLLSINPIVVDTPLGNLEIAPIDRSIGESFTLLIRPDAAALADNVLGGRNFISGRITSHSFRGRFTVLEVMVVGEEGELTLVLEFPSLVTLPVDGSLISLSLIADRLITLE